MFESFKLNRKIRGELRKSGIRQREILRHPYFGHAGLDGLISKSRSKTLYILGSGSSVCALTPRQWEQISKCDSVGINFWIIHRHIPNYYVFEVPRTADNEAIFLHDLRARLPAYRQAGSMVLLKSETSMGPDCLSGISDMAKDSDVTIGIPRYFTVSDTRQFRLLMENYEDFTRHLRERHADAYFRKRASVVFATMLGYEIGFTDIVLCGIDGKAGSGYFYQFPETGCLADNILVPGSSGQIDGRIHKTMDSSGGGLTAGECLRLIDRHLFRPKGVRMWVGTGNSILSDWLPSWPWSD